MRFDWRQFLAGQGIPYQLSGARNITTRCPFCGSADAKGHYLSISLQGKGWRCFRNPQQHRGRSYVRLLIALLHCSEAQARDLLGEVVKPLPEPDRFSEQWRKQLGLDNSPQQKPVASLKLPPEFHSMQSSFRFAKAFWDYLIERGFNSVQSAWLVARYNLHYAVVGQYAYRLIVPIYSDQGKLITWTGRSISPTNPLRYMSLNSAQSVSPPSNMLLGLPLLWRANPARYLVVCEGPFDAFVVTVLGYKSGIWGTCLFGLNVSNSQADLLADLTRRFDRIVLLIDSEAQLRALSLRNRLPASAKTACLPAELKDPGELLLKGYTAFGLEQLISKPYSIQRANHVCG